MVSQKDKHDQAWQANATTVEQGIARAAECRDIADRLSRHRITIGPHALIDNLDRNQSELLWKAWRAHHTRNPGEPAPNPVSACPTRHAPPTMSYDELLRLQPDDPFWNDGLFTNGNEPWAIDINTQRGIRFLASLKRSREEH
ncbi:hypothetical protein KEM48_003563 [Puccinia striiformis f. sp. tritici PST-130]|nr:hypothetical protein KEM48_003563 [Puccinia striiformis f. sp. tritici PST-130]